MTLSYWLDTPLEIKKKDIADTSHFDIAIVGAGVAGLSMAYWLEKKDPNLKIVILDQGTLGTGASGRNAGFVTCGSAEHFSKLEKQFGLEKTTEIWKFSEINRELLKSEIFPDDCSSVEFTSTGSCTVAPSETDWNRYQILAQMMLSAGIDVELINETYLEKNYGVRNFLGAIQYKHDGVIHPIKLLKKIKSHLKNTKFIFNAMISSCQQSSDCWSVFLNSQTVQTKKIIFCLNGYTNTLLPELHDLVKPQRGQIIVTEPLTKMVKGPCYLTKYLCYFRQLPQGELLVGGFRNQDLESENTNKDCITDEIQNALAAFTKNYFYNTQSIKITHRWSGIMGFTPDGQMLLGALPNKKNSFILAGFSGHGLGLSFHAAKVLVESMCGKVIPNHLKISRFH